jgi:hypothetical protein
MLQAQYRPTPEHETSGCGRAEPSVEYGLRILDDTAPFSREFLTRQK